MSSHKRVLAANGFTRDSLVVVEARTMYRAR
jgi:hypothetical protein